MALTLLSNTPFIQAAGNPVLFKVFDTDYKIGNIFFCDVYVSYEKDIRIPGVLNMPRTLIQTLRTNGDGTGNAEFNISPFISSCFTNTTDKPLSSFTLQKDESSYLAYFTKIGTITYNSTNQEVKIVKYETIECNWMIQAALPLNGSADMYPYCLDYTGNTVKLLTNLPGSIHVKHTSDLLVNILFPLKLNENSRQLTVKGNLYFRDGTVQEEYIFLSSSIQSGSIYRANVKPSLLQSHAKYDLLYKYVIWFEMSDSTNTSTSISETKTVMLDEEDDNRKSILFKNRLGGWDSADFNKKSDIQFKIKTNASSNGNRSRNFKIDSNTDVTYTSFWLTKSEKEWLKDLLLSPALYIEDNYYNITDSSFKFNNDDDLYQIELTVTPEYEENSITL